MAVEIVGNLVKIEFNNSVMPKFKELKNKDFVYYGEENNYLNFLIDLYNKHPEHGAIIKSKVKYIVGKGLKIDTDEYINLIDAIKAEQFLEKANRFEDWDSVFKKTVTSLELFNGFCWQIIWDLAGLKCEVYPLQFSKCRVGKDGKTVMYADSWLDKYGKPLSSPEYSTFDIFNPNVRKGAQMLYYKVTEQYYDGIGDTYPLPEYIGAVINIYTDVAVSEFQNNLALNGMTAQGMLSLFKGEPTEDEKKKLERLFNSKFTGVSGSKVLLNFANEGGDKGAEWTTFQTSDLDKQFELISKTNQQKIITGHQIPNKSLVGISVEGALSDRTAIDLSFEQLNNTYTEPRRELFLEQFYLIGELNGVDLTGVTVKPLKPIGIDYLNPNIQKYLTENEIRDYLGLEKKEEPESGTPSVVNENLRALSGKDWIHIKRLIREVKNGKTTRETASLMIRSAYGLSDSDINVLFGESGESVAQFNSDKKVDDILSIYEMYAQDDNEDEVFDEYFEFERVSILESNVLDILKGEPTATANKISKMLDEDLDVIEGLLAALVLKGLIDSVYQPTEKGLGQKTISPDVEVYTVYKYVTRDDVPRAKQTRPFCKRLLTLTATGKVWTKEAIDNITNELGEDAWTYRGGFYTDPQTNITTPYCRHVWKSVIKTRKK